MKIKTRPNPPLYPEMSEEMRLLIEDAYRLFDKPIGNRLMSVCTDCCISKECEKQLLNTPVRELSRELIYDYLDAAYRDKNVLNEVAHFLPRILELLASYQYIRHSTEIILEKCYFESPYWNHQQQDFIKRYSTQFITDILKNSTADMCIDNAMKYIVMFSVSGLETAYLFSLWEEMATTYPYALEHFEIMMYYDTKNYSTYQNCFSNNPKFNQQVNEWINSPRLAKKLLPLIENYYFKNSNSFDEMMSYRWNTLYDVLQKRIENNKVLT